MNVEQAGSLCIQDICLNQNSRIKKRLNMISKQTIETLLNKTNAINLTLSMPTHKTGEEIKQDPIRFKNLLKKADTALKNYIKDEKKREQFLEEVTALQKDMSFWNHSEHGLVITVNNDLMEIFKLPYEVQERVYIQDHFLITPLLPMISVNGTYGVLALSQRDVRLLHCSRNMVRDITPEEIAKSAEEYLEVEQESHLQFHTGSNSGEAMFFGHGGGEEDKRIITEQFFREVEKGVTEVMRKIGDPLVLIGLEENSSFYRSINKYDRLLENSVKMNPDEQSDAKLQKKGWEVVTDYFLRDLYKAMDLFNGKSSDLISNNMDEIITGTIMGKSDVLFISNNEQSWGRYDADNHTIHYNGQQGAEDYDLLNWTAIKGMESGTKVFMLPKDEMPNRTTIAALFRF